MNWKIWLHGLAAAAISAFASGASGAIGLPAVFTLNRVGFTRMAAVATIPALLAVFAYLRTSPIPAIKAEAAKGR